MTHATYMPHVVCWRWDWPLVIIHAVGDLGTFVPYFVIPLVAVYIYRRGRLRNLRAAYPKLWLRGAAFVLFCSLNHLGAFTEIWVGGFFYWITGINKLAMAGVSVSFAREFWKVRDELVLVGRVLERSTAFVEDGKAVEEEG